MTNINTHILCEPYEIEDFLSKNEIDPYTFSSKTLELIESTKNSNYKDLELFRTLDEDLIQKTLSLEIPDIFLEFDLNKIYQYSNKLEIDNLIIELDKSIKNIYNLDKNVELCELEVYINNIKECINKLNERNEEKVFNTFGDITNFKNILSICDNSFYESIFKWITEFPNKILDIQIEETVVEQIDENKSKINKEDTEKCKKDLMYLFYNLYESIIKNIIDTKLFWSGFLELIDPETNVDELMFVNDESETVLNSNNLFNIGDYFDDMNSFGSEAFEDPLFGLEADNPITTSNKKSNPFAKAFKTLKTLPGRINKVRKQFKMFRMRAKNHAFYMKYMGRIEGLYERYADEAPIMENGMKGDPVQILKEEGHAYITDVSNGFVDMQHELIDVAKKFESSSNPKDMFNMLKKYGGMYMNDTVKSSSIVGNFITSMCFKIGELILKNNKIYGYTAESIAENNKLPPSNHAIVSLFVDRPDEKPFDQRVSDIFKSPDSFKLIAKNEKEPIFEVTVICSDLLTKGIQEDSYKMLKQLRKNSTEKFKMKINDLVANSQKPKKEKRELTKQFKHCWRAIIAGYDYLVSMKGYISDLIQSYFVMMTRIDNLCKECLVSLLHTETMHRDERYDTGHKADSLKSHKQYTQHEEDVKTKGEKELERDNKKAETKAEYAEKKARMNEHLNEIKKAMQRRNW